MRPGPMAFIDNNIVKFMGFKRIELFIFGDGLDGWK